MLQKVHKTLALPESSKVEILEYVIIIYELYLYIYEIYNICYSICYNI